MWTAIVSGITLGILLTLSVGPIIFAIIKQSLTNGQRGGYAFVAGVSASDWGFVLVCTFLTQLIQEALTHKSIIGICGSIFLIVLGIYTVFFKKININEEIKDVNKKLRKRDLVGIFFSGLLMNTLNPGAFLFWLAATAKINSQAHSTAHPMRYMIIVFATCLGFILASDLLKVNLAGKLRKKLTPHNILIINRIGGIILIVFGIGLIFVL